MESSQGADGIIGQSNILHHHAAMATNGGKTHIVRGT